MCFLVAFVALVAPSAADGNNAQLSARCCRALGRRRGRLGGCWDKVGIGKSRSKRRSATELQCRNKGAVSYRNCQPSNTNNKRNEDEEILSRSSAIEHPHTETSRPDRPAPQIPTISASSLLYTPANTGPLDPTEAYPLRHPSLRADWPRHLWSRGDRVARRQRIRGTRA